MFSYHLQTFPRILFLLVPKILSSKSLVEDEEGGWCSYLEMPNIPSPLIHVTATARQGWVFFPDGVVRKVMNIILLSRLSFEPDWAVDNDWGGRNNRELLQRGNFHKRNGTQILRWWELGGSTQETYLLLLSSLLLLWQRVYNLRDQKVPEESWWQNSGLFWESLE